MINKNIVLSSREEISSNISQLRYSGKLSEAIILCKEAINDFPNDYFFLKIAGDLFFQQENYKEASESYLEFLKKIPPNNLLFRDFVKRYYRLRRIWDKGKMSKYASFIMDEIDKCSLSKPIAVRTKFLIKSDLTKDIIISDEGEKLIGLLNDDAKFNDIVNQTKRLEEENSLELEYILDQHIFNRTRMLKTYRIDSYYVSIYEKMGKYENALKLAEQLLSIRLDGVLVRAIIRICRKMENYQRVDDLLSSYPEILKIDDFNILYELVYYFEEKNDFDQVHETLNKIENFFFSSPPILKTLKNFYLRFGLLEDVIRVKDKISKLYAEGRKGSQKFLSVVQESEKEFYSEFEHQKRLAAISELTTGISHELGQPITNIRYTVQFYKKLFEKKIEKESVFNVFSSILEETERMGGLIKRLSPITSSRSVIEKFDLMDRIQKRVKAEYNRLYKLTIMVNITPKKYVYLVGDPVKFDQLISNLLINSIYAIKQKKKSKYNKINIKILEKSNEVKIIFSDNGIGIPVKYRGKIFDPFFTTKAPGKGEGLGLFIIWNLLKMQGGKISLDSKYKNGARFIITIPKKYQDKREN